MYCCLYCSLADSVPKLPDSTPFYPHHRLSSDKSAACLETILNQYYGKDREIQPQTLSQATPPSTLPKLQSPSSSPSTAMAVTTPPAPAMPTSSQSSPQLTTPKAKKAAQSLKPNAATKKKVTGTLAKRSTSSSAVVSSKKNHLTRKISSKFSLPSLLSKSSRVSKASAPKKTSGAKLFTASRNSVNRLKASKVIEQLKLNSHHARTSSNPSQFLTLLPPRTPYQSLLMALSQACKGGIKAPSKDDVPSPLPPSHVFPPSSSPPPEQQHSSPSSAGKHTHSVFHDHFALLSTSHIPSEFCSPITSLSLQLPIDIYTACVRARVAREEHSYAKAPELLCHGDIREREAAKSLKLSLPRSLLQSSETMSPCACDRGALVFCSCCRSLYHSTCSSGTLCSNCITLKSLNLS